MSNDSSNGRIFWAAALSIILLDVVTKVLVVRHLTPYVPHEVFGSYGRLTLAYNPGAAFSMSVGSYSRIAFGTIAAVALGAVGWWAWTTPRGERMRILGLGLVWGGAAGNLIDRLRSGRGVVDFIDIGVGTVRFWTFNVADSGVTIGACLLALALWHEEQRLKQPRE